MAANHHYGCLKKVFLDLIDKVDKGLRQCIERQKNLMTMNRIIRTIQLENLYTAFSGVSYA